MRGTRNTSCPRVPAMGDGEGEWLLWAMSSAMPTCNDCCGEVGLLGEMPMGSCSEVSGIAIDRSSSISVVMLGWETISLGHSVTECRDEISVENC